MIYVTLWFVSYGKGGGCVWNIFPGEDSLGHLQIFKEYKFLKIQPNSFSLDLTAYNSLHALLLTGGGRDQ